MSVIANLNATFFAGWATGAAVVVLALVCYEAFNGNAISSAIDRLIRAEYAIVKNERVKSLCINKLFSKEEEVIATDFDFKTYLKSSMAQAMAEEMIKTESILFLEDTKVIMGVPYQNMRATLTVIKPRGGV